MSAIARVTDDGPDVFAAHLVHVAMPENHANAKAPVRVKLSSLTNPAGYHA